MIAAVRVGVALRRPPRHDADVFVLVAADTDAEARCLAAQIASCWPGVVMAVSADIVHALEV